MRPIILGICSAFFFAFTFVLNQSMELSGGSWIWSASLRIYLYGAFSSMYRLKQKKPPTPFTGDERTSQGPWLLWSFVGFGLFYAPLCFASAYSPGWLIAGTWQITIISGALLAPLFFENVQTKDGLERQRGKVSVKGLLMSMIILLGIILMQLEHTKHISMANLWLGVIPIVIASFAYPLGNRKMMEVSKDV